MLVRWQIIERAKRKRLIDPLLRLNLPLATRNEDSVHGLSFRFLSETLAPAPVLTGHAAGIITIALAEDSDDAAREYRRTQLNEPYRTLLGHFRHEAGHHYWDILVSQGPQLEAFRSLFGDERQGYDAALTTSSPARRADGLAGALHLRLCLGASVGGFCRDLGALPASRRYHRDGGSFRVRLKPKVDERGELTARLDFDPYGLHDIGALIDNWIRRPR